MVKQSAAGFRQQKQGKIDQKNGQLSAPSVPVNHKHRNRHQKKHRNAAQVAELLPDIKRGDGGDAVNQRPQQYRIARFPTRRQKKCEEKDNHQQLQHAVDKVDHTAHVVSPR